jgi:hypothetical protein
VAVQSRWMPWITSQATENERRKLVVDAKPTQPEFSPLLLAQRPSRLRIQHAHRHNTNTFLEQAQLCCSMAPCLADRNRRPPFRHKSQPHMRGKTHNVRP